MSTLNLILILIIFLITILGILMCFNLYSYKKSIRNITMQIKEFKDRDTNKKIDISISDKDIENLAVEVNEYLELFRKGEVQNIKFKKLLNDEITNISHDLRTPLTSIKGYIKLFEENKISKEEALKVLRNKTNKLNVLINDFFEIISVQNKDYIDNLSKINLNNFLNEEILSFYEEFEERKIKLNINLTDEIIFIYTNKEILERIIDNLISNSLKYSDGIVNINLNVTLRKACIEISNTCKNLTNDDVLHIFDRFYMADKVRNGQSAGLGLAIVKTLIEKINGSIIADFENNLLTIKCKFNIH